MRIIKLNSPKQQQYIKKKQRQLSSQSALLAQTSNVQRFLERDNLPPHLQSRIKILNIQTDFGSIFETTALSSRCNQSLFRRPQFYNPHYGAFHKLHFQNRGQADFRFRI
ncbi:Hypothetical_protein [Hexamita inflata]|uniref:Hypothetical_protein n=1 Tax=Hexamita inflata TaxID=28002 RepID=A0AA86QZS2_9EUKA|nr:Hypothetical protein HINF_LOCUS51307 [Hexamita inflata]